eukprot:TRINITY_DN15582_c0_g1_i2.p2 TRINITY_DN15582_c0_g1~~TRINITY_DN15582_c0_g1_i2.p2  ORF type:complete len:248 (+),score=61.16 TRINITY_DN15582_c0_g1_i2:47-790(+)
MPGRVRKVEYVSLAGLRLDGRKPGDPRELEIELGCFKDGADGSAAVVAGGTKVVAAVYGPREVVGVREDLCSVSVQCQYAAFSSASGHRRVDDRQANEVADTVKSVLEDIIIRSQFPSSAIDVFLNVLADDGSVLTTLLNAASVALVAAGIPVLDLLTSCSASFIQSNVLADITHEESRAAAPSLNIAILPSTGDVAMLTFDNQIEPTDLQMLIAEATKGCQKIHAQLKTCVVDNAEQQFKTRAKEK